jgi:hypothetical protein
MKLKSFCTTKETVTKWKRLPTEREKIFHSYTSEKGFITQGAQKTVNSPQISDPMKKWADELNRDF